MGRVRILVAPTAFKGTLGAVEVAEALAAGAREALPDAEVILSPIADGGDGTLEVLLFALDGDLVPMTAMGPLGRPVDAAFAWLQGDVAVVELASASGLALIRQEDRDPLGATTRGTGDLIATALEQSPRRVIVGAGGSATNDGGAGIVEALGIALVDSNGAAVGPGALGLLDLERVDLERRDPNLAGVELVVACDVSNPLVGPDGAARVFAPQKGAEPEEVEKIEEALTHFASTVERDTGVSIASMPRAGAAGGAAGGMHALLGAELRDGFDVVAESVGFDELVRGADLVIVGEGSLDDQSLAGKAPIAAARRARRLGIPVWAFAGEVKLDREKLKREGIEMDVSLVDLIGDDARSDPAGAIREVSARMLKRAFG